MARVCRCQREDLGGLLSRESMPAMPLFCLSSPRIRGPPRIPVGRQPRVLEGWRRSSPYLVSLPKPSSFLSSSTEDGGSSWFWALVSAASNLSAFLGERKRWAVSRRLSSSSAEIRATSLAFRRRMMMGSRVDDTSSQRAAKVALAFVYVVTVGMIVPRFGLHVQIHCTCWVVGCQERNVRITCTTAPPGLSTPDDSEKPGVDLLIYGDCQLASHGILLHVSLCDRASLSARVVLRPNGCCGWPCRCGSAAAFATCSS